MDGKTLLFHLLDEQHDWNGLVKCIQEAGVFALGAAKGYFGLKLLFPQQGTAGIADDVSVAKMQRIWLVGFFKHPVALEISIDINLHTAIYI